LCERAQQGDRGAFDALVKATYDRAYTVAYHLVRSREDAKDIVQEAFIRVHKHLADFQHEASFNTWLYRVVVNLGLDWHRRRKFVDPKTETNDCVVADKRINPEEEAAGHELGLLLEAGLQTLSPDHRAALVLFEVEGLSYEEIAEVMRVRIGTVMSRLFTARKKMQKFLSEKMPERPLEEEVES
jgi:RNA polymerase sigma-70 factor (ECF subfamily)